MKKKIILVWGLLFMLAIQTGCKNDETMVFISQDGEEVGNSDNSGILNSEKSKEVSLMDGESSETADIVKVAEDSDDPRLFYVVYVCGEVLYPGVYQLKEGSRVFDAVSEAGGYSENAASNYVNLAKLITDEEMIYIPSLEEIESGEFSQENSVGNMTGLAGEKGDAGNQKVNLNSASKEELMTLPGVGESKANAIISYRQEKGKFKTIEDIMQISGIKEGMFNKIKDSICVK